MDAVSAVISRRHKVRRERTTVNWQLAITLAASGIVLYLVLAPLAVLVVASLKSEPGVLPFESAPLSLANYINIYRDPDTYNLLFNSFVFAIGSLFIGFSLSVTFSWLIERTNLPLKNIIYSLILVPLAVPGMLAAISWILLLDPRIGVLNIILRTIVGSHSGIGPFNIYTLYGMFLVQGIQVVPTAFLMMSGAFRSMDPSLEEASRCSGQGTLSTALRITLPMMGPAIFAAAIYFFILTLESFEIPGVIGLTAGLQVFSTRIYWASHPDPGIPDYGGASTLAVTLLVIAGFLMWLYGRVTRRAERYRTVTGKGYRTRPIDLGKWKYVALAFFVFYFVISVLLPFIILFWASLHSFYLPPSIQGLSTITFDAYRSLFSRGDFSGAIVNTLLLAVVTATVTMFLVSLVSWVVVRSQLPGRRLLDTISFLPQAIPSMVVGLAVLFVYLSFPNPFYGTIGVIAIALITKYLAFGSRTMSAGFLQLHPELEEASQVAGASWLTTYRKILLPLMAPIFINGWIWVAIHSMRELSAALMLSTPNSVVVSTQIWSLWQNGAVPEASVLGVLLILTLAVIAGGGRWLLVRYVHNF